MFGPFSAGPFHFSRVSRGAALRFAYAYAKRGQILLCEEWARMYPQAPLSFRGLDWGLNPTFYRTSGTTLNLQATSPNQSEGS